MNENANQRLNEGHRHIVEFLKQWQDGIAFSTNYHDKQKKLLEIAMDFGLKPAKGIVETLKKDVGKTYPDRSKVKSSLNESLREFSIKCHISPPIQLYLKSAKLHEHIIHFACGRSENGSATDYITLDELQKMLLDASPMLIAEKNERKNLYTDKGVIKMGGVETADISRTIPTPRVFEDIMRSLRRLQQDDLEAKSSTIFDNIYERCSNLKDHKYPIEIAKIILKWGSGNNHTELFEGWSSPVKGKSLLEWVEDYEDKKLKQLNNVDFIDSRIGNFVLELVSEQLNQYDEVFEAIKRRESEEDVSKIWKNIKPKDFFKNVFLSNILLFDKVMVNDYEAAIDKLKQEPQKEFDVQ